MNALGSKLTAALTFVTSRVRVRLLGPGDVNLYCSVYGDEDTMRHVGPPLSSVQARRSFAAALRQTRAAAPASLFATVAPADGSDAVGICGLREIDPLHRRAEVGLLLLPAARARGLGNAALCGLVERCLAPQVLDEIYLEYTSDNVPMARLASRAAFVPEEMANPFWRGVRRLDAT